MPILNEKAMYDLKWNYNYFLKRFYKGCRYIEKQGKKAWKFYDELFDILESINALLKEIMSQQEVTEGEILYGFNIGTKEEIESNEKS